MVYPWQVEQWQRLWQAAKNNRLPHAILLTGNAGMGKAHFAECFVRAHFCKAKDAAPVSPCACPPCRLISSRAHPNLLWIQSEKPGGAIKIDQIRDINEFVSHTSLQGEQRFVIINAAHQMNIHAANALLKALEEPSSGSLIALISNQHALLSATILGRCQRLAFPRPPIAAALAWLTNQLPVATQDTVQAELLLRLADGAPLAALRYAKQDWLAARQTILHTLYSLQQPHAAMSVANPNDVADGPIQAAATIQGHDPLVLLNFILAWTLDVCKIQVGSDEKAIMNQDFKAQLAELSHRLRLSAILNYMTYLQHLRKQLIAGVNFNKQLMVENILIRWMECASCS
jgi:DNA polymerase-3 subunit delta'